MEENQTSNTNTAVPESVGNKKKMGCLPKVLIFIGGFIALFFIIVFISAIIDLAKSKNIDMLHGSLWDKMVIFALPLALTGMLQQLYNAADVAVLGKFVGTTAMAAVGNNIAIIGIIYFI